MRDSGFDPVSEEIFSKRIRIVTMIVAISFFALVLRLWGLQIMSGPRYRIKSENNRIHLQDIMPLRGMIFDRNGKLLVDDRPSYDLYLLPEETRNRASVLQNLNTLIGLDPLWADDKIEKESVRSPFRPILIKRDISRDELAVVETNLFNLPGIMIQVNPQRNYIYGTLASHLIGYMGEISERQLNSGRFSGCKPGDLIGKYGIEGRWQKYLNGVRGGKQVEVDAAGRQLRVMSSKPPVPGYNLTLTIDSDLQAVAEEGLKGMKGAVAALDPNTGEVLALASSPAFDPNLFIKGIDQKEWMRLISSKDSPLQNRAISGQYPPGSVFKIVVALAGLEEDVISPAEEVFCSGSYSLGSHIFRCWKRYGHGKVDLHRALVESCDVYFYRLGKQLGVDQIAHYAHLCGLGRETGIGLENERSGLIPTSRWKLKRFGVPWQAGETLSTSIGQSFVLVTPLQMARLISAVFNGGHLYRPEVIKWAGDERRKVYQVSPTITGELTVAPENLEMIRKGLVGVVNELHGTGTKAKLDEIMVAGKTGTAQVIRLEAEKTFDNEEDIPLHWRDHAWFVAVAPADDPLLALAILVENGGHGGSTAAPLAKKMIEAYLFKGRQGETPVVQTRAEGGLTGEHAGD